MTSGDIRYSHAARLKAKVVGARTRGAAFFAHVAKHTTAANREGGILLVGGTRPLDIGARVAQARLRYDQLPSCWSHAALVLDWADGAKLHQITGLECTLEPERAQDQAPEHNGVTPFRASRYADEATTPHLTFACINWGEHSRARDIRAAALDPNRDRARYSLWHWLGAWSAHLHDPDAHPNPVAEGIAHPGAAFVEMAYGAADIQLTPGATAPNTCPEMLWSSFLYWYEAVGEDFGQVQVFTTAKQGQAGPMRAPSASTLPETYQGFRRSKPR
jgi:hypothetical protein